MKTIRNRLAVVLLGCLPLLAACNRQQDPTPAADTPSQPTSALGGIVKKATDEAREKLATENISISEGLHINVNGHTVRRSGVQRKAEITPQGDLLIENKAVAITPAQRALLLQYRQHVVAIAEAGMEIGVQGADLGMTAASEAIQSIFSGNTDQVEQRVEAEAAKIEAAALQLCHQLPALLSTQQQLAASLPEFTPYATMDQSDVDDCLDETADSGTDAQTRPGHRDENRSKIRSKIRSSVRQSVHVVVQGAGDAEHKEEASSESTTSKESAPTR